MSKASQRLPGERRASLASRLGVRRQALAAVLASTLGLLLVVCSPAAAVGTRATAAAIKCTTPVAVGQPSTCTATVSDIGLPTRLVPTGMVSFASEPVGTFSSGECKLEPVPLQESETASCSVKYTPTQVGSEPHKITAKYPGDAEHEAATSPAASVTVTKRQTSASVECVSPVVVGQPSTCIATVSDIGPGTRLVPKGKVGFASVPVGTFSPVECELVPVSGKESETASCSVKYTPTQVGSEPHKITAKYLGDVEHEAATSTAASVTVTKRQTSTSVKCASPVAVGQPSECTATVSDTSPPTRSAPTGSVSFASGAAGGFSQGTCKLVPVPLKETEASCSVLYTPSEVGSGKHTVTAKYPGDETHEASSESGTLVVRARASSASVSCGAAVVLGQAATCVATVKDTSAAGATAPTGMVSFSSDTGGGSFGLSASCALVALATPGEAGCLVQYTPGQVASGTHTITAEYGGDAQHAGASGKGTLSVGAVTKPPPPAGGSSPPPPAPSAPKCRLVAKERWLVTRRAKHRASKVRLPVLSVSYSCDQSAAISIEAKVAIAAGGRGSKRTKAKKIGFTPASSQSVAGQTPPAVVVALGSAVSKALGAHLHARATIKFTVRNANGVGVATIKLTLVPLSKTTHA